MARADRAARRGDAPAVKTRLAGIEQHLHRGIVELLESQGVRMVNGVGRLKGPHEVVAETDSGLEELSADAVLLSTGSRPRIPDWAEPDGERLLTTRQAYPPPELPEHLIVIGSGVTGVEFVHMFRSFGSQVTLVVSRQQVLPQKDRSPLTENTLAMTTEANAAASSLWMCGFCEVIQSVS